MKNLVKLPWVFFTDHEERDLDTPTVVKATKTHALCYIDDPAIEELFNDAQHYAKSASFMDKSYFGLCMSARATEKAILKARSK